jgi:hypothetical protein
MASKAKNVDVFSKKGGFVKKNVTLNCFIEAVDLTSSPCLLLEESGACWAMDSVFEFVLQVEATPPQPVFVQRWPRRFWEPQML